MFNRKDRQLQNFGKTRGEGFCFPATLRQLPRKHVEDVKDATWLKFTPNQKSDPKENRALIQTPRFECNDELPNTKFRL
jgi:hypothetical protein